MKNLFAAIVTLALFSFIAGCDKGIEPEPLKSGVTGFSGKVTFVGNWPADIKRTHVVLFKNVINTSADFFPPNLAFVIDSIPYRSTSFTYNSVDNNFIPLFTLAPGDYNYLVVAQSKTAVLSLDRKDWLIVGIYNIGNDPNKPRTLTILDREITSGVDIIVDFNNPPPQPPM
ncbi:MAG: hypothetical protein NTX65_10675 [Ignavibacteriales bacterium]|nr:hypothetical protein [Ignavibacteriales bacterium]